MLKVDSSKEDVYSGPDFFGFPETSLRAKLFPERRSVPPGKIVKRLPREMPTHGHTHCFGSNRLLEKRGEGYPIGY